MAWRLLSNHGFALLCIARDPASRLRDIAETGAQFVSVGALTHSVHAADISFELEPLG